MATSIAGTLPCLGYAGLMLHIDTLLRAQDEPFSGSTS
jgi:hypothetical protein